MITSAPLTASAGVAACFAPHRLEDVPGQVRRLAGDEGEQVLVEQRHVHRSQENSNAIFNSALVHELAVLRPLAEPLLLQVRYGAPEYVEANRLLSFLQWFLPAPPDTVPDNSILREFVGGSILETFWR
jgi:hypothetical protein